MGVRASAGFRRAVSDALPGIRTSRSVLFQLLDDLPTALLVSGYALLNDTLRSLEDVAALVQLLGAAT